jgi:hypothetical protein
LAKAETIIADLEKIPEEIAAQQRPRVTKRVRYEIGQERIAKEAKKLAPSPTPLETLTAKIKAGEASGQEIKQFVKTNEKPVVEEVKALRQNLKPPLRRKKR